MTRISGLVIREGDVRGMFGLPLRATEWRTCRHFAFGVKYRPGALKDVADLLDALDPANYGLGLQEDDAKNFELYEVQPRDNLSKIAAVKYGNAEDWPRIFKANLHQIDNPHRIYPGQLLRVLRD